MKKVLLLLFLLVAVGTVVWGYRVEIQEWYAPPERELALCGNIDDRQVNLAFTVSERIAALYPEEGTSVKKGELVGTLETVRIEKNLAVAQAALGVAKENLTKALAGYRKEEVAQYAAALQGAAARIKPAKNDYARLMDLAKSGAVSSQELDEAEATLRFRIASREMAEQGYAMRKSGTRKEDIAIARAQVTQAEAECARLEQTLLDTKLVAPCDGIVRRRVLEPGEIASPQMPVLKLAVLEPKWVRVYLPEKLLSTVTKNSVAKIYSDGWAEPFDAWVGYVSPTAEFTPKNVETPELRTALVYECRVYVKDPERRLKLGAPVTVRFPGLMVK